MAKKRNNRKLDAANSGQVILILRERLSQMTEQCRIADSRLEEAFSMVEKTQSQLKRVVDGEPYPNSRGEQVQILPSRYLRYSMLECTGDLFAALPSSEHVEVRKVKKQINAWFEMALEKLEERNKIKANEREAELEKQYQEAKKFHGVGDEEPPEQSTSEETEATD